MNIFSCTIYNIFSLVYGVSVKGKHIGVKGVKGNILREEWTGNFFANQALGEGKEGVERMDGFRMGVGLMKL